jgi:tetratricopeptide (TPR) repeat protein/CHAT domain-containing protein
MVGDHPRRGRETTWSNPRSIFQLASFVAATLLAGGANAQSTASGTPAADGAAEEAIAEAVARADRLLEQGKFAEAIGPAREAAHGAARAYGPGDWRAFDAGRRLKLAETASGLPDDQRNGLVEAIGAEARARGLEGSKPAEAEGLALCAAEEYAAVLGERAPEHARTWHLIGRLRVATGDKKGAQEANLKALAIRRVALPLGHPDVGRSLTNLGIVQHDLGDVQGALASHNEALGIFRRALKPDDPLIASSLDRLGVAQYDLLDYAGAMASHEGALAIRRKALPANHPDIAMSLRNLGIVQAEQRDYLSAKTSDQEALAVFRKALPRGHPLIAGCLNNLGIVQHRLGDHEGAKASYEEALGIYGRALPSDHPLIADCLMNTGSLLLELPDFAGAKVSFERALAIRRKTLDANDPRVAHSLEALGLVLLELGDYAGAKEKIQGALTICRRALPGGHRDIAECLNNLGVVHCELGDYAKSKANLVEALAIRRTAIPPDEAKIAETLNNLGLVQVELQDYEGAKVSQGEALKICRRVLPEGHPDIAKSLDSLGCLQRVLRGYEDAKVSHEMALAIFRKALPKGHPSIAQALVNLGLDQFELRDYTGALESYREALATLRMVRPKGHPHIAMSLVNIGNLQLALLDYGGAMASCREALAILRMTLPQNHPDISISLYNLGIAQHGLRDYAGAKASLEQALAIQRKALKADDPDVAVTLSALGGVQGKLRDYAGAKASLEQALAIRRKALKADDPGIAVTLSNLGAVQGELQDYAGARHYFKQAFAIFQKSLPEVHPFVASSLYNLGHIDLTVARPTPETVAHLGRALILEQAELLALAGCQAEAEQSRAASDARSTLSLYLSATLDPASQAEVAVVYNQAAGLKGLVTARQRWARQLRVAADPDTRPLLDRLQTVNLRLLRTAAGSDLLSGAGTGVPADAAAEVARLDAERRDLERRLMAQSAAFRRYREKAGLGGDAVQAALPQGACLIDFLEYAHLGASPNGKAGPAVEARLLAFVVRPGGQPVRVVELGPAEKFKDLVNAWREQYVDRKPPKAGESDPGAELRELVWLKLEPHLGAPEVVLVSPDGPLNPLPLAALPGKRPGTFLVHEYTFASAPAPILLPELVARKPGRPGRPSLLLVGGVDFGEPAEASAPAGRLPAIPRNWKKLPGTESEVAVLSKQFKGAFEKDGKPTPCKELTTDEATKAAFVRAAPGRTYVHLATHGFFADEAEASILDVRAGPGLVRLDRAVSGRNPGVLSAVVFAGVNRPPGGAVEGCLLTALEAAELDLRDAELVTLSACQSGVGLVAVGEGVVGLQRAFQVAGARTVLASQWRAPDEASHALMREFYARLWSKTPLGGARALREAQLWMIAEWRGDRGPTEPKDDDGPLRPYFWAAFTLSGDWR